MLFFSCMRTEREAESDCDVELPTVPIHAVLHMLCKKVLVFKQRMDAHDWHTLLTSSDVVSSEEARMLINACECLIHEQRVTQHVWGALSLLIEENLSCFVQTFIDNGKWVDVLCLIVEEPDRKLRRARANVLKQDFEKKASDQRIWAQEQLNTSICRLKNGEINKICFVEHRKDLSLRFANINWDAPTSNHHSVWHNISLQNESIGVKRAIAHAAKDVVCMRDKIAIIDSGPSYLNVRG